MFQCRATYSHAGLRGCCASSYRRPHESRVVEHYARPQNSAFSLHDDDGINNSGVPEAS
jgi:hypothetical protein